LSRRADRLGGAELIGAVGSSEFAGIVMAFVFGILLGIIICGALL
jgi:hypothetical protein